MLRRLLGIGLLVVVGLLATAEEAQAHHRCFRARPIYHGHRHAYYRTAPVYRSYYRPHVRYGPRVSIGVGFGGYW